MSEPIRNQSKKLNPYDYENSNPMSHREALDLNAVELYALNDLTPEQELRFEEHYFECRECARAVAVQQALATQARAAKPEPWWRRLAFPVLTPATAALLTLAAFQNFQSIPSLKTELAQLSSLQPNTVIMARPVLMGTQDGESIKTPSVTVEFTLPPGAASPFYRVELLGDGKQPISQVVPAPDGSRLSLHVTSHTLGHGPFNVMVYGLTKQESKEGPRIGQYHFNIQ
jgi:hypothetical protein